MLSFSIVTDIDTSSRLVEKDPDKLNGIVPNVEFETMDPDTDRVDFIGS
ncbi:MAG: hypothetical protein AAF598_11860 [Bacteroidota bacterium]